MFRNFHLVRLDVSPVQDGQHCYKCLLLYSSNERLWYPPGEYSKVSVLVLSRAHYFAPHFVVFLNSDITLQQLPAFFLDNALFLFPVPPTSAPILFSDQMDEPQILYSHPKVLTIT